MPQIDRSRQAEEDILEIAVYIARDNPTAAARWIDQIEEKILQLAAQPLMGEAVDHIHPGLRRFTHGKFLIFYEPRQTGIGLVRIIHGARKIENLF